MLLRPVSLQLPTPFPCAKLSTLNRRFHSLNCATNPGDHESYARRDSDRNQQMRDQHSALFKADLPMGPRSFGGHQQAADVPQSDRKGQGDRQNGAPADRLDRGNEEECQGVPRYFYEVLIIPLPSYLLIPRAHVRLLIPRADFNRRPPPHPKPARCLMFNVGSHEVNETRCRARLIEQETPRTTTCLLHFPPHVSRTTCLLHFPPNVTTFLHMCQRRVSRIILRVTTSHDPHTHSRAILTVCIISNQVRSALEGQQAGRVLDVYALQPLSRSL